MKELIDNKELIIALEELEKEKGIKKEYVIEAIETALVTAYKRNFDAAENVKVVMDQVTGATHIYAIKEVVQTVENNNLQISIEEAKTMNKKAKEGDNVEIMYKKASTYKQKLLCYYKKEEEKHIVVIEDEKENIHAIINLW